MNALSYSHGVTTTPLIGEAIGVHFDRTVQRWGDRPALISRAQGVRWTWRELGAKVDAFAAGLLAMGLRAGERVGIWSPNNAEWIVTQYATAKAGLILVNINPAYRLSEVEYALNKVGCRALVIADQVSVPHAEHAFDDRDKLRDTRAAGELKTLVRKLVETARLVAGK